MDFLQTLEEVGSKQRITICSYNHLQDYKARADAYSTKKLVFTMLTFVNSQLISAAH